MTVDELAIATEEDLADPLGLLASASYRWGDCQAIRYDSRRADLFDPDYLGRLYDQTQDKYLNHIRIDKGGSLPALFCGMPDLSKPAIIGYLYSRPLIILGEWAGEQFIPLGYCFTVAETPSRNGQRNSAFGGYCFFSSAWRTPQQYVLTVLGLAYLFHEFRLVSLHGIRYDDNKLTARWMGKFGFRDIGTIPNYMQQQSTGELVPAVVSTLDRAEFEQRVRTILADLREHP